MRESYFELEVQSKVDLQTELLRRNSRLGSLIILSGAAHTGGESLQDRLWRCVDLWNNLSFSLYAMLSIYCMVVTLDNRKKSKMGVSTDLVCHCWTSEIKFNKKLSSSIIRLANYSVTTSLIYELLL